MAPGTDIVDDATSEIVAEADRLRDSGRLPPGYEEDLDRRFAVLAQDPEALTRAVAAGALTAPQAYGHLAAEGAFAGSTRGVRRLAKGVSRRSLDVANGLPRRGLTVARRVAGPRLRSLERHGLDQAGRLAEAIATKGQVTADHARRWATSGGRSSRLDRLSPGGRTLAGNATRARGSSSSVNLGATDPDAATVALADWAVERLRRAPHGPVLHVECGEGGLVRRLATLGFDATGADPAAEPTDTILRGGALEHLGGERRSSLGGLVLSGVTEEVSPASARALAHLAASRLRDGGVVVVVSSHPIASVGADPITSDLALRHPLHPVTWCHLLARFGFREITVLDPAGGSGAGSTSALYAVAGCHG